MKKILLILLLLVSYFGYSQSGLGYVDYKIVRTHYGNGSTSQYPNFAQSSADFNKMLDLSNPANTLIGEGEVVSDSQQGFARGLPPGVPGDYFVVEYTGWFYAELGGRYLFYTYSDDSAEVWVDGSVLVGRYNGPGTSSAWITLEADTWYPLKYRWQEYTGGAYGYLQVYGPKNGYFYPGGASAVYKVSNDPSVMIKPHKLDVTYNINNNLDKTKFQTYINILDTQTTPKNLSANGIVNYTENDDLDITLYPSSKKATTVGGSVEWGVLYDYDATNSRHLLLIDRRELPVGLSAEDVTQLQLFDLWDGEVTYYPTASTTWAYYYIYTNSPLATSNSNYSSYIRDAGSYFGLRAEFSFEDILGFTPHEIVLGVDETYWSNQSVISIQDIALSFSELTSNSGPGLGGGGTFTTGIEYILGDVNQDGSFDFQDTQLMLQHLFGDTDPFETQTFNDKLRMFESGYDTWDKTFWSTNIPTTNKFTHTLDENNKEKTKSLDVAFLGDVNFSHSHQPSNLTTTAKSFARTLSLSKDNTTEGINLSVERVNDIIKLNLDITSNQKNIIGSQFKIYFDNDRIEYMDTEYSNQSIPNFSTGRTNYVNVGSFSSDGSQNLNGGITYTLNFKLKEDLQSTLGLVAVTFFELVDKNGQKVNLNMR